MRGIRLPLEQRACACAHAPFAVHGNIAFENPVAAVGHRRCAHGKRGLPAVVARAHAQAKRAGAGNLRNRALGDGACDACVGAVLVLIQFVFKLFQFLFGSLAGCAQAGVELAHVHRVGGGRCLRQRW